MNMLLRVVLLCCIVAIAMAANLKGSNNNDKIIFSVLTTKRTKYKFYIEVLDQLKQAGATKISIANPPSF